MRTTVKIQPDKVLHSDFLGVGVNIIPVNLMKNNRAQGYTEAHWEMDKKRIIMMKPKVARVWFQIDWMEPEKGSYVWDRPEMLAFYSYMSVLQEAETEVELNFGWKIGRDAQSWFSIPGAEGRISAPHDLDAYAASCSALLHELIVKRGYVNVKYYGEYQFMILTTLTAQTQVEMTPVSSEVASGESLQLSARVIDNMDGVVWSTSGEPEFCGQVTDEGLFIAPIVNEDRLIAVRAISKADAKSFGVSLIRVRAGKEDLDA